MGDGMGRINEGGNTCMEEKIGRRIIIRNIALVQYRLHLHPFPVRLGQSLGYRGRSEAVRLDIDGMLRPAQGLDNGCGCFTARREIYAPFPGPGWGNKGEKDQGEKNKGGKTGLEVFVVSHSRNSS